MKNEYKMKEKGSIEYAKKEALKHAKNAEKLFKQLKGMPDNKAKKNIEAIVNFVIEREL